MKFDVNKENLLKIRDIIANHPARFDWSDFVNDCTLKGSDIINPQCGAMCCVAGFAMALACPPDMSIAKLISMHFDNISPYSSVYEHIADQFILNNINDSDRETFHHFLYYPWYFRDANGDYIIDELESVHSDIVVKEALSRIDWLLDGQDVNCYVITDDDLLSYEGDWDEGGDW